MHHPGFQAARRGLLRSCLILVMTVGLGACVADPGANRYARMPVRVPPAQPVQPGATPPGRRIAILLPLTGANAELGQALLKAAQLALDRPDAPPLDSRDTGGTPAGAVTAARAALDAGAGVLLGPLTTTETAAVAPIAMAAGVPVLAFTSDNTQAQVGVWTLGITPAQQARRLVAAVQAEGKTKLAAVLPQNPFGDALSTGYTAAAAEAGLPEPQIIRYANGFANLNASLKDVSGFNTRRGATEDQQRIARARRDAEGRREAADLQQQPVAPPPIDALLLGAAGDQLGQAAPLLAFYDIAPAQVRILGPAIWSREVSRLGALSGAWFAAPDPAQRQAFTERYTAKYNSPPRDLASLAYDAAAIARVTADADGFPIASLTRPEGFVGADGPLILMPEGQVRRGLAIFEIGAGGARIVQPTPAIGTPGT